MGMVYYGRFAEYFEIGRVELIRSLGLTYDELETSHRIWMPVMSMQVRYIRPARYDQELRIRTSLRAVPLNDITFFSEIFNDENIKGLLDNHKIDEAKEYIDDLIRGFDDT